MSDEDRAGRRGAGGERDRRDGARRLAYRLRLVAHDRAGVRPLLQRRREPDALVPPALPVGARDAPDARRRRSATPGDGYVPVNEAFADAVVAELDREPDAAVFFHDYHLYLAPELVRDARPDALLTHFIHIPWPQTDYWHVLPADLRVAIHEGLLANDVVGFHTERWRRNFLRCVRGHRRRRVDHAASTCARRTHDARHGHPIGSIPRSSTSSRSARCSSRSARSSRRGRSCSSSASTAPIRRRTSCAASMRSRSSSSSIRSCAGAWRCSRCSIRRGRTCRSTPSTSRAIEREARRVNERFERDGWHRSTCRSPTTSRSRSPPTSSTTCCSSTRSSTG